jgi:hypothetical protein
MKIQVEQYMKSEDIRQDTLIVGVDIGCSVEIEANMTIILGKELNAVKFVNNCA